MMQNNGISLDPTINILFDDNICIIGKENESTLLLAASVGVELIGYTPAYIYTNDYTTLYLRRGITKGQIKNQTILKLFKNFVTVE